MYSKALSCGLIACALIVFAEPRTALAQHCTGTVVGLSSHYNEATGSGFLAVLETPGGPKVAELFNGDKVEITGRKGNWYSVIKEGGSDDAWVSARWMRNSCGY